MQSNRAIYLLDDSGSFNGIESFFTVERIKDLHSIHKLSAGDILLTTRQDEELTERLPDGVRMIVCVKGEGSIPEMCIRDRHRGGEHRGSIHRSKGEDPL